MTLDEATRNLLDLTHGDHRHDITKVLVSLIEMVQEDCAKSCEKTAQNWSANNDDYKDVALTCAEDIRKIRYLIRN